MKKRIGLIVLIIIAILVIFNFDLIRYGIRQASGQIHIIYNARPVEQYLNDSTVSQEVKDKLRLVDDVKAFAHERLHLAETDNYTEMYDQQGKPVLWVVTGCEPFSFQPYQWTFPVLGSVPYKGFFKKHLADQELEVIKSKGLDAGMRTVGGWSTLGWFNDPILSEMLNRSNGDLANLIIHELVHSTIFVKDSVEFNENLASFIADKGTLIYMSEKYGTDSDEMKSYINEENDNKKFIKHMLTGYDILNSLYLSFDGVPDEQKLSKKEEAIKSIINNLDTLKLYNDNRLSNFKGFVPNNTYFMSFKRYQSKQGKLDSLFNKEFDQELVNFIEYLKNKHPYL
ncbi:aminopeptidase [Fulvivirga lutimaris]|uniref:aminopeptidase n=1 Tax=Fulvivirga lutimaris TaxID=1819566 RepID=UPI0012BC5925|nr:aminopeptidase [Fulvivirga lutimaris]MTI41900.1 aminopeptidase [Fulvivirga lutimaris]